MREPRFTFVVWTFLLLLTRYWISYPVYVFEAFLILNRMFPFPEDVSVVGFDDIPFGAVSTPELTTIHVYKQELGKVAVRRVLDHVQYPGRHEKMKIQISTKFVERGSVKNLDA